MQQANEEIFAADTSGIYDDDEGSKHFFFEVKYKSIPVNTEMANALSAQFIENMIFIRKQIPCTYPDLMKHAEEEAQRRQIQKQGRRLTANFQKKALRFVQDMEIAFRSLRKHFLKVHPTRFLILFGSSINNPKEGFLLDFCNSTGGLWHEYTPKQFQQASRKLIRNVFVSGSNGLFQSELKRPWNIFLLCYGNRLTYPPMSARLSGHEDVSNDECNDFSVVENFRLKKPRSRRGKPIFQITITGVEDGREEKEDSNSFIDDADRVWYKYPKRIKGIKVPPQRSKGKTRV